MKPSSQRGQTFVFFALVFIFLIVPFTALALDFPSLWMSRRDLQKLADEACLAGAIAAQNGNNTLSAIINSLDDNAVDPSFYSPNEGAGTNLGKGIEIGESIRVALWGPTLSWWSQLIPGVDGWEIGARAHCQEGLGGFYPLSLKEWEGPGSRIYETSRPNDEWSGPCDNRSLDPDTPINDPARQPPLCWVWGDWQVLAGDGHVVNEGRASYSGILTPDVRCQWHPGTDCDDDAGERLYIPPAPDGSAINPLKDLTEGYISAGGYDGPLPVPGVYSGVHSALIVKDNGVSNNFLVGALSRRRGIGDELVVFVYRDGEVFDSRPNNYEYVEVIGYVVVRIVDMDANSVFVVPVFPPTDTGPEGIEDDLPKTLREIEDAGYDLYPVLIPWD